MYIIAIHFSRADQIQPLLNLPPQVVWDLHYYENHQKFNQFLL